MTEASASTWDRASLGLSLGVFFLLCETCVLLPVFLVTKLGSGLSLLNSFNRSEMSAWVIGFVVVVDFSSVVVVAGGVISVLLALDSWFSSGVCSCFSCCWSCWSIDVVSSTSSALVAGEHRELLYRQKAPMAEPSMQTAPIKLIIRILLLVFHCVFFA